LLEIVPFALGLVAVIDGHPNVVCRDAEVVRVRRHVRSRRGSRFAIANPYYVLRLLAYHTLGRIGALGSLKL